MVSEQLRSLAARSLLVVATVLALGAAGCSGQRVRERAPRTSQPALYARHMRAASTSRPSVTLHQLRKAGWSEANWYHFTRKPGSFATAAGDFFGFFGPWSWKDAVKTWHHLR